jgi:prephenate dehydrogenase
VTLRFDGPVGIVGLGLVGGSLARALHRRDPDRRIVGVDADEETLAAAASDGVLTDASAAPGEALQACEVVFICTPLGALDEILVRLGGFVAAKAVLTDVIGIKGPVEAAVRQRLPDACFVGGHPMAGGERGGFANARADLFEDCSVALCPGTAPQSSVAALAALWQTVGARPITMSAAEHDELVAATSHLPYLTAVALTRVLSSFDDPQRLAGRGLRDAIRHAGFAPEIMVSVAAANQSLPEVVRRLAAELEALAQLAEHDAEGLAAAAEAARRAHAALTRAPE